MKIDKSGRKLSDASRKKMGGATKFQAKHGMRNSPEYYTWTSMKARCNNPKVSSYKHYGGRGITVCDEWQNSFESFFTDVGARPEGYSLERIDTNGNYEPGNTAWIPLIEQQRNKRNNVFVIYCGEKLTATEYAKATGQKPDTVRRRLARGLKLDGAYPC